MADKEKCVILYEGKEMSDKEKHVTLYLAVENIETVTNSLESLIAKLEGSDDSSKVEPAPKQPPPAFVTVLDASPGLISVQLEKCHQCIERIKELLF